MNTETSPTPAGAEVVPETTDAAPAQETAEAVETPEVSEQTDAAPEDQPNVEAEKEAEAQPQKKHNSAQERINDITRRRREAERESQRLDAENQRLQARLAKYEGAPPKLEDFEYDEDRYRAALAEHSLKQVRKDELADDAAHAKQMAENAQGQANADRQQAFQLRAQQFAEQAPDFHEALAAAPINVSDQVMSEIMDSEMGPQVAYYMAKNPGEAAQIASLSNPTEAARAVGRLEARLSQPLPKRTTQAPPPMKPVAGGIGAKSDFDPNNASVADYAAVLKKAGVIQ